MVIECASSWSRGIGVLSSKDKNVKSLAFYGNAYQDSVLLGSRAVLPIAQMYKPLNHIKGLVVYRTDTHAHLAMELGTGSNASQLWADIVSADNLSIVSKGRACAGVSLDMFREIATALNEQQRRRTSEALIVSSETPVFPSAGLVQFAIDRTVEDGHKVDFEDARAHITNAVFGLFRLLSDSLLAQGQRNVVISEGGRFKPPIAEALLTRVSVPYYRSFEFTDQLHAEVLRIGGLSQPTWSLKPCGLNTLELNALARTKRTRVPQADRLPAEVVTHFPSAEERAKKYAR